MEFYFCETCGKRVTGKDLEAGLARNKKLNGVFCAQCAAGVMTMETLPVSEAEARKVLAEAAAGEKPAPAPPTGEQPAAKNRPPRSAAKAQHKNERARERAGQAVWLYMAVGLVVALAGIFLFLKREDRPAERTHAPAPPAKPTPAVETKPERVVPQPPVPPAPPPALPVPPAPVEKSPEPPVEAKSPAPVVAEAKSPEPAVEAKTPEAMVEKPPAEAPARPGAWVVLFNGRDLTGSQKGKKSGTVGVTNGAFHGDPSASADIVFPLPAAKNLDIVCEVYAEKDVNIDLTTPSGSLVINGGARDFPTGQWVALEIAVRGGHISARRGQEAMDCDENFKSQAETLRFYFRKDAKPGRVRGLKVRTVE